MAEVKVRSIVLAAPTSTGTQSHTISGFGRPRAATVRAANAVGTALTDDLVYSHGSWAEGGTDDQGCCYWASEDNVGSSNTWSGRATGIIVRLIDPNDGSVSAEGEVTNVVDDGIEIDWTTVSGSAHAFELTLYGGANIQADFISGSVAGGTTGTSVTTTDRAGVDFEPDLVEFTGPFANASTVSELRWSFGVAHNDTSIVQYAHACDAEDALDVPKTRGITRDDSCLVLTNTTAEEARLSVSAFNADGFDLDNTTVGSSTTIYYQALAINVAGNDLTLGVYETQDTSVNGDNLFTTGFQPQYAGVCTSTHLALNTYYLNGARSGGYAFGYRDLDARTAALLFRTRGSSNTTSDSATQMTTSSSISHVSEGGNGARDAAARWSFGATSVAFVWSSTSTEVSQNIIWALGLSGDPDTSPNGIASTAALGTPTLTPGAVDIDPVGIASTSALGTPTLAPGPVDLSPLGISATSALGTPTLAPGAVVLSPVGISSTAALGTPTLAVGAVDIPLVGLSATSVLGTPTLSPGAVDIPLVGITSTSALGTPTLATGGVNIPLVGIASTSALGTPTLAPGPVDIPLVGLASTAALGTPTLALASFEQDLPLVGIPAASALGTPTVALAAVTAELEFEIVNGTVPGSLGTQDITVSGRGTPKLVMIVASYATADDTYESDAGLSVGFIDQSGNELAYHANSEDAQTTADSAHAAQGGACVWLRFVGTTGLGGAKSEATFDSFITDGVRIEWLQNFHVGAKYTAYLWYGDVQSHVEALSPSAVTGGSVDVIAPGFQPHQLIGLSSRSAPGTGSGVTDGQLTIGVANFGDTITQGCTGIHWPDGAAAAEALAISSATDFLIAHSSAGAVDSRYQVSTPDSDGFTLETIFDGTVATQIGYVAIRYGAGIEHWAELVQLPTSGSSTTLDPPGFPPSGAVAFASRVSTLDSQESTGGAGTFQASGASETAQRGYAITLEDGSDPTVAKSYTTDSFLILPQDDTTTEFEATASFGSLVLTWGTAPTAAFTSAILAFGKTPVAQDIPLVGIASTSALGTPTVAAGAVDIPLVGIASASALGTPTVEQVAVAAQDIPLIGIPSTSALGVPFLDIDPLTLETCLMKAQTERLNAVNTMLSVMGEPPMNSLGATAPSHVRIAEAVLDETLREVQSQEWNFNTLKKQTYTPDASGNVFVANDVLWVNDETRRTNLTLRNRQVFNLETGSYTFTSGVTLTTRVCLDWDCLPEPVRRYAMIRAARVLQQRLIGSVKLDGFTREDEAQALEVMRQFDNTEAQYNLPSNASVSRANRRHL